MNLTAINGAVLLLAAAWVAAIVLLAITESPTHADLEG